jgi:hypothetical protein
MCETRAYTLWEEHRLWVFEDRVQRRIFQPKEVAGAGRKYIMRSLIILIIYKILLW